jgi:hypothetical protein
VVPGENPPVGLILCAEKDNAVEVVRTEADLTVRPRREVSFPAILAASPFAPQLAVSAGAVLAIYPCNLGAGSKCRKFARCR